MGKKATIFLIISFIFLLAAIFRPWFFNGEITGGDWPYFFNETLAQFPPFPPSWGARHGNGLGGMTNIYFLDQYLFLTTSLFTNILHIPWVITYKIFWFGMFIVLSVFSSIYLFKTVFPRSRFWQLLLSAIIFTTNTYILMVVGGGQMGIALAYAIAPLVLARLIKLIDFLDFSRPNFKFQISNFKFQIVAGLVLGVQVMFDPRIAYITMLAVILYLVLHIRPFISNILHTSYFILHTFIIPIGIASLLNASWIIPLVFFRSIPIPEGFTSGEGFQFLSFADFSHALSLLHPNWPENIFGKTYFLKPEFLVLPIIVYSSLLFISKIKDQRSKIQIKNQRFYSSSEAQAESRSPSTSSGLNSSRQDGYQTVTRQARTVIYFCLLGLIGVFLAKGANPPFGEVNQWLFQHIPGMNLFRDPTKWYILVAISYSVLIPFSVFSIQWWLKSKIQSKYQIFNFAYVFLIFTLLYLLFLIRPVWLGQLTGTFKQHTVPKEYIDLKNFLYTQPKFFRTLWVPRQPRFAFTSNVHPGVEATALFQATDSASSLQADSARASTELSRTSLLQANSAEFLRDLQKKDTAEKLSALSIKYLVVPYDSFGEIFVKDREYDEEQYNLLVAQLKSITWLKRKTSFGRIIIFETQDTKGHFYIEEGSVSYTMINSAKYLVDVSLSRPANLIFSENYSPYWKARVGSKTVSSERTKDNLNAFPIVNTGHVQVEINFDLENYYKTGRFIAIITLLVCTIILLRRKGNK